MSGLVGKGVRSYKKAIVSDSNFPALGFVNFIMAFQADASGVAAGVAVDLTSVLTVPAEMVAAGFQQPDGITIVNAQLGNFRNNVIVTSNLNGVLIDRISYTLTNDSITFDDGLNAGEIIVIKRGNEAVTGNRIVDARPLRASGDIDFSMIGSSPVIFQVGEGFRIAPSTLATGGIDNRQIGFVQVFVDGVLQARNVGNENESMLPASEQSGNYREVIVDGLGNLITQNGVTANAIEFNQFQPFSSMEGVIVISTNLIVDSPNSTGLIDGVDALGARVTAVETNVTANTAASTANTNELATIPTVPGNLTDATDYTLQVPANTGAAVWAASGGGGGNNLFQRRNLSTSLFANTSDIASLRFANLTSGRIYRVTMQADFSFAALDSTVDLELRAIHNGNTLCSVRGGSLANGATVGVDGHLYVGTSVIFTASATTCTFSFFEHIDQGDLLTANTFTQLEELMNYTVTTQF